MEVVWLDAAEFWADTPSGVNEAGWYVQVDEGSYSGPYQSRDEAEQAIERIRCGDVVELAVEALEALRDGADEAGGFGCENRLREHARRRLVDALAALDVDHMRPMGVAR